MVIIELVVTLNKKKIIATIFNILRVTKSLYFRSSIITKSLSTEIIAVNKQENVNGKYRKKLPIINNQYKCPFLQTY